MGAQPVRGPLLARDAAVLVASLAAIGLLALLGRATEPTPVDLADLAAHEGDLVAVSGTVASEPALGGSLRFFLRDATGSARVAWRLPSLELHEGDGIKAEGRAVWLRGSIELQASSLRRLELADAPHVRLADVARDPARFEGLLVRLEAFAEPGERAGQATLRDASGAHRIDARVPDSLDASGWVEWAGVLRYDDGRMRYLFEARA